MPPAKTPPAPFGVLDKTHTFDIALRIRSSGKAEVIEAEILERLERELPLHFHDVEVKRIKRATR